MKFELSLPQTSTSLSHMDGFWSVCDIKQPLPAHIKSMYLIQSLSSFSKFTAKHKLLGKQTISVICHYRLSRNVYEILMWLIKKCYCGGWGEGQVLQIFTNAQFTHQQSIIWRHLKYINTNVYQNVLIVFNMYEADQAWNYISAQWKKYLKIPRDRDTTNVNSDDSVYNAP
jgi:hypothetical protein